MQCVNLGPVRKAIFKVHARQHACRLGTPFYLLVFCLFLGWIFSGCGDLRRSLGKGPHDSGAHLRTKPQPAIVPEAQPTAVCEYGAATDTATSTSTDTATGTDTNTNLVSGDSTQITACPVRPDSSPGAVTAEPVPAAVPPATGPNYEALIATVDSQAVEFCTRSLERPAWLAEISDLNAAQRTPFYSICVSTATMLGHQFLSALQRGPRFAAESVPNEYVRENFLADAQNLFSYCGMHETAQRFPLECRSTFYRTMAERPAARYCAGRLADLRFQIQSAAPSTRGRTTAAERERQRLIEFAIPNLLDQMCRSTIAEFSEVLREGLDLSAL